MGLDLGRPGNLMELQGGSFFSLYFCVLGELQGDYFFLFTYDGCTVHANLSV